MSSTTEKDTAEKPAETWHVDAVQPVAETETETNASSISDEGAVNALLILACIAFGSASFVFGFDDKVISPLAALTAFVRPPTTALSLVRRVLTIAGARLPGPQSR